MNKIIKTVYLTLIYTFLYLPVVILIAYSFNNSKYSATWFGGTLKWYKELLHDKSLLIITGHSLIIAVLASTIAMMIGLIAAVAIFRYRFHGKKMIYALIFSLIIMPDLVFGIALLILYAVFKIDLGFWTLLLAHITFCLPFVIVTIYSRLKGTDKNIFEAARDLGASDYAIFSRIIIPLMLPALIASWLLCFTLSIDDVIISFFVTGPTFQILPLYIYSLVHVGITPEVNALCTLILGLTVSLVLILQLFNRKKI